MPGRPAHRMYQRDGQRWAADSIHTKEFSRKCSSEVLVDQHLVKGALWTSTGSQPRSVTSSWHQSRR